MFSNLLRSVVCLSIVAFTGSPLMGQSPPSKVDYAAYALAHSGAVGMGSQLFSDAAKGLCATCHTVDGIANHGESGESYSASLGRGRLNKVIDVMKPADYLFLQFAHNDMKERGEGKGAFLNFKVGMEQHIAAAREKGGIPVLITPMHRRRFDSDGKVVNTFGDYPEAVRQTAREMDVPLIDLLRMSAELYEALGPEGSSALFKQGDGTHHNNYGAYQLAKCVVEGIRKAVPDAAHWLVSDLTSYSPAKPDPIGDFQVPASASVKVNKPDGE